MVCRDFLVFLLEGLLGDFDFDFDFDVVELIYTTKILEKRHINCLKNFLGEAKHLEVMDGVLCLYLFSCRIFFSHYRYKEHHEQVYRGYLL